jgi:hypothetical protein
VASNQAFPVLRQFLTSPAKRSIFAVGFLIHTWCSAIQKLDLLKRDETIERRPRLQGA